MIEQDCPACNESWLSHRSVFATCHAFHQALKAGDELRLECEMLEESNIKLLLRVVDLESKIRVLEGE